ncbi:MAG: DNA-directed RNA polymerase subunit K [Thermoplasmatales archaeon]
MTLSIGSDPVGDLMAGKTYSKYEKARIIGARALQISMGAPILIDVPKDITDPLKIAMIEFENDAIPMTVIRRGKEIL